MSESAPASEIIETVAEIAQEAVIQSNEAAANDHAITAAIVEASQEHHIIVRIEEMERRFQEIMKQEITGIWEKLIQLEIATTETRQQLQAMITTKSEAPVLLIPQAPQAEMTHSSSVDEDGREKTVEQPEAYPVEPEPLLQKKKRKLFL